MNIWLAEIWRSWRASLRRPGFLLLTTCVLGLGVGASAAVFALVDHVLLQPLPFPHASQLVVAGLDMGSGEPIVSSRQYRHLQSLHGVESIGLLDDGSSSVNVLGAGMPQRATVLRVDRYLLPTLGVHLMLGRNFTAQEDRPHGSPAAILSHGFWERNYGGDTGVIGKQMMVKGASHTIVGVLPARFDGFCRRYLHGCDIVLPAALSTNGSDATIGFLAIARMEPGATVRSLGAEVRARMHRLYASATDETSQWMNSQRFGTTSLSTALHARSQTVLVLFMASALFVLLIAWVNLTNLLFLRTLSRQRDVAIREALGALGLHRHLPVFAESLLVGVFGGLLGVGLAAVGLAVFRHFVPASWMVGGGPSTGASVWAFALVAAVVVALIATWLGLWKGRHDDVGAALHEGGRSGPDPRAGYLGRALVVVQVALATVLLAGAGLFLHALMDATQVPLGFNPHSVLTFQLTPIKTRYPDVDSVLALGTRIRDRLAAQPGVVQADLATSLPMESSMIVMGFQAGDSQSFGLRYVGVDTSYFTTFDIPLVKGRAFQRTDQRGGEHVAVVNQALARKYFGGHALGETLHQSHPESVSLRIVGVVADTRQDGPLQPARPIVYVPWQQVPAPYLARGTMRLALKVRGNPDAYRQVVHAVMAAVAPMQPIAKVRTAQQLVAEHVSQVWLMLLLVGVFALFALSLAATGIYAVMAVVVASREHEFGVRTALGASPARLVRGVLRGGLLQIVIGLSIGIGVAVLLSGTLHALLAQIGRSNAFDPWAIAGVCVLLAIAGLLACLRPAMRAGHVQPMRALRRE